MQFYLMFMMLIIVILFIRNIMVFNFRNKVAVMDYIEGIEKINNGTYKPEEAYRHYDNLPSYLVMLFDLTDWDFDKLLKEDDNGSSN